MPTVPVNAAGWRIEPPVSVAVAPAQRKAETAAADPPDEPPGTSRILSSARASRDAAATGDKAAVAHMRRRRHARLGPLTPPWIDDRAVITSFVGRTHGELVHVELAEHHRAIGPEIGRHSRFVTRLETVEDVAAGLGVNAFGREQILDAERNAFERPAFAPRELCIRGLGHVARLVMRHGDIGVEARIRGVDRR